ncbi:GH39 family glycosyl hydrolase [Granulicella aggregans]|nr:glycosyl hydrolase family 39 [Granulicella aggregans]
MKSHLLRRCVTTFARSMAVASALSIASLMVAQNPAVEVSVDAKAPATPFPHFWEQTFGSGRAILSLRDEYRQDIDAVHEATGFQSIRFHGIFNDEVGLYDPARKYTNPGQATQAVATDGIYNFSYVDQIYDGLLEHHVRPFVELSFMPKGLAADPNDFHIFWYHPNVSPPADYAKWDDMMSAFARHLIARYGIEEVSTWSFEVWNEPNLDFWDGKPKQATYWELYDHTAKALKAVNARIRVGGPSTAQAAWVSEFLQHCHDNNIPVDFASTHVYGNDDNVNVLHTDAKIPRDKMVPLAVAKVHKEILASPYPQMPLYFSEYNASYANEPNVTDSYFIGPWLATTISQVDGQVQAMSYWDFADVFEEQGVTRTPFYGGFGLIAEDRIQKPAFHAFAMLHKLGDQRIAVANDSILATKTKEGGLALALWNYLPPIGEGDKYTPEPSVVGENKTFEVEMKGLPSGSKVELWRVDGTHGNAIPAFDAMGRPQTPTREQLAELRKAGAASPPESLKLKNGKVTVSVPARGLVVLVAGPAL